LNPFTIYIYYINIYILYINIYIYIIYKYIYIYMVGSIYIYHEMLSRVSPTPVHSQAAKMDLECGTETAAQGRESGERCLRCGL
jgi:hypothetical protein